MCQLVRGVRESEARVRLSFSQADKCNLLDTTKSECKMKTWHDKKAKSSNFKVDQSEVTFLSTRPYAATTD